MTTPPPDQTIPASRGPVGAPVTGGARWRALAFGLIGLHALLVLTTFAQYGITYDEDWNSTYGYHVIQWYVTGFADQNAFTYWTLPYEGAFFNVLVRVIAKVLSLDVFETGHLVGGFFGVAGTFFAWRLGSRLGGARTGAIAALLLVTAPRFYGHAFASPRDLPMAVLALAALDGIVRLIDHLPRPGFWRLAAAGVPLGLSLAVRMGSIFLVGYTGLALGGWLLWRRIQGEVGWSARAMLTDALVVIRHGAAVVAIAWACMLPFWPKALVNPLWPIQSFIYTTQEFGYDIPVFFEGQTISNQHLPWYYVLKWFLLVLPEHLLAGLALAAVMGVLWLARAPFADPGGAAARALRVGLVVVAAGLPLGYATLHGVIDYDGIRHFLFVIPPLVVLAALGIDALIAQAPRAIAAGAVVVVLVLPGTVVLADMVRLHPYQYIYFNRLVAGGLPGAHGQYDTEYWGASYKEGVEWLVAHYTRPDLDRRIRVVSNSYALSTSHYLPADRFEYLGSYHNGHPVSPKAPPPDVFLSILRWEGVERHPGRVLHTVERMGVPLLRIIEVQQP